DHRDHGRGSRSTVGFTANISFVKSGECIMRMIGWDKTCKPGSCPLLGFWSPLRSPCLACDFYIFETRLMSGAGRSVDNVDHPGAQLLHRFLRRIECLLRPHFKRGYNFIVDCLDVLDEASLIKS